MALGKLLLLINDEVSLKGLQEHLEPHAEIAAVRTLDAAHDRLGKEDFDLVIADAELIDPGADFLPQNLSGPGPAVVILASAKNFHSVANAECAFGYLLKPFSTEQLDAVLKKADDYGRLLKVNRYLSRGFLSEPVLELVGTSPQMEELRITLRKVGRTHATVLIGGESGVGKELVARTLFLQSPRADAALIKVDCAKIPEHLLERELFGSGKTGLRTAGKKEGCFELAQGATILLREIGLIPLPVQARLLRLLQTKQIERSGGKRALPIDTRIIATTNRNLEKKVKQNEFREDLFLALNIVPITVPPLRQRKQDISALAEHFRQRFSRRYGVETVPLSASTLKAMEEYPWPGNIRELRNRLERGVLLSGEGGVLRPQDLGLAAGEGELASLSTKEESDSLAAMEKQHIFRILESCGGNRTRAAEKLDISIRTLRNKLREYRIQSAEQSSDAPELKS